MKHVRPPRIGSSLRWNPTWLQRVEREEALQQLRGLRRGVRGRRADLKVLANRWQRRGWRVGFIACRAALQFVRCTVTGLQFCAVPVGNQWSAYLGPPGPRATLLLDRL
jgi:hypothetical protein